MNAQVWNGPEVVVGWGFQPGDPFRGAGIDHPSQKKRTSFAPSKP